MHLRRHEITSGIADWRCSEDGLWRPATPGRNPNPLPVCGPSKLVINKTYELTI